MSKSVCVFIKSLLGAINTCEYVSFHTFDNTENRKVKKEKENRRLGNIMQMYLVVGRLQPVCDGPPSERCQIINLLF